MDLVEYIDSVRKLAILVYLLTSSQQLDLLLARSFHMDGDAPVFVKRPKSKTVTRKPREVEVADEEESRTPISNFKNRNKLKTKPQQRLSFGNDNEVSVFSAPTELILIYDWSVDHCSARIVSRTLVQIQEP